MISDEEKKAVVMEIKENMEQDNKKMLDDLIDEIEQKMRARDLSDKYLEEHGTSTREDIGIGEYAYGITMIPCEWIYPYLLDLQSKNNLIEKQSKEIEELKEENENLLDALNNSIDIRKYWVSKNKIKAKIEELILIADNGANAVRFAMTHDDEVERRQKQKDISAMIDILQSLLEKE